MTQPTPTDWIHQLNSSLVVVCAVVCRLSSVVLVLVIGLTRWMSAQCGWAPLGAGGSVCGARRVVVVVR